MDNWRKLADVITEQKRPDIEFITALSFGAPLMFVPGQYNGLLHAYSHEGGAHKSTALRAGAAGVCLSTHEGRTVCIGQRPDEEAWRTAKLASILG